MENKNIINFISEGMKISRTDLIEKDIILTKILSHLSSKKEFFENYAFKGGTCIIKCYLGYYRFSEDLDFTYLGKFKGKSEGKIREEISNEIENVARVIEEISKYFGLRFKAEKENKEYFQFGGGNAFVTMKLWYNSVILDKETFIKIQINFKEKLEYPIKETRTRALISKGLEKEFITTYKEEANILVQPIKIKSYDLKEVLIEKVRAILTRRGVKSRDFIDVYEITTAEKIGIKTFRKEILDKTHAMMRFEKYKGNLENKKNIDFSDIKKDEIKMEEESILLKPIHKNFDIFLDNFKLFLIEISKEV